ncbi:MULTISPECIES: cytochrome c biogenesis protein ResB [Streptomyces]|uniref:cytochrome c biogenesis protein ResB n=1 Tax=Streptomyces TaxID=1883 RepID=UPI002249758B|nr:cytochrome c biogenesis protein ResB [Streptomyces sp. JHD 1]MCX2968904.1 cytochrome c biogenesis protein ResB [Streptomyces sp. JHD 1]
MSHVDSTDVGTRGEDARAGVADGEAGAAEARGTEAGAADARAADADARAARAELTTTPAEEPTGGAGERGAAGIGVLGWARWFWRQLTSMRVALLLLLLLSLGAVPGSLIPQNGVDEFQVAEFKENNPTLADVYEALQLFDVYSSVWFSAIYLLLFVSLIGCIVPRTWQFVGQLRSRPPRAPRRLDRMPAHATWHTDAPPEEVLDAARGLLRGRRFRVAGGDGGADSVAAEKGYLREAGNLVFHLALIVMLVAFAVGQLWYVEGGKLVVQGHSFSNTLTQYDDIRSGPFYDYEDLGTFGFTLEEFHSAFEPSGPQKGTPRDFRADVSYWDSLDGAEHQDTIEVNKPLAIGDSRVHLLNHGYAPVVTVRDGQGELAYRGPVPFIPQDDNGTAQGVIKVTDYRDADGEPDQLGFIGLFTPTFGIDDRRGPHSTFPALNYPVLSLSAYHGDLGVDAGLPQSVYQLDDTNMEPFQDESGDILRKALLPGESLELPDGAGTLKFERIERWASFQISEKPATGWALGGALAAIAGLAASLFIQRRRVWVRARAGADGRTVVELAGLGRSESARLPEELGTLAERLTARAARSDAGSDAVLEAGSDARGEASAASASAAASASDADDAAESGAAAGADAADPASDAAGAAPRTVPAQPADERPRSEP